MAIQAKAIDDLPVYAFHRPGRSPRSRLKRVCDIRAKRARCEGEGGSNPVFGEPWMCIENLFDGFSRGQLLEDGLHGYTGTGYDGLAHHHLRIGNDLHT
jgi:hypothetical protein